MKKRKTGINPVERACIAQRWDKGRLDAQIHALTGNSSDHLVIQAGRMFYVALVAAVMGRITADDPDIRIVRGAVNAMHEQAGEAEIAGARRASIASGLQAVQRLVGRLERRVVVDAACEMELHLRSGDIRYADFLKLVEACAVS